MKNALLNSGIKPEDVDYVEAHATGTNVGDTIESAAIIEAYSSSNLRSNPLLIGSGKTNIGHTESCSGIAAIIKVLLALKHELIPPHISLKQLSPKVNFEEIPGKIALEATSWIRSPKKVRIAGVSNFGITGTDVHMIIQEAPKNQKAKDANVKKQGSPIHLLAFAAKTDLALEQLTNSYINYLQSQENDDDALENMVFTANARRTHQFSRRKVGIGRNRNELIASLKKPMEALLNLEYEPLKICFIFGHETLGNAAVRQNYSCLYSTSPIFKKEMDQCSEICRNTLNFNPAVVFTFEKDLSELERHLCSFSVTISLFKLWEYWGIKADLIIACGIGKLAGKVAAGLLTIPEAFTVIAETTCHQNLIKTWKNQSVAGSIPYLACDGEKIELFELATQHGCNFCIEVELQQSVPGFLLQMDNLTSLEASWSPLISTLGSLYTAGYNVDWEKIYGCYQNQFQVVSLPHYPFQRKAYWFSEQKKKEVCIEKRVEMQQLHPLLGHKFNTALTSVDEIYQSWLTAESFLREHVIGNEVIFPAAGFIEMVLAAQHFTLPQNKNPIVIENFVVHRPLQLQSGHYKIIQTIASSPTGLSIYSCEDEPKQTHGNEKENWKIHASATQITTQVVDNYFENHVDNFEALKSQLKLSSETTLPKFYDDLARAGLELGPRFQSLQKMVEREGNILAQLANIPDVEGGDYICHPLLIDAMIQCFLFPNEKLATTLQVPVAIQKFVCFLHNSSIGPGELFVYRNSQTVYLLDSRNNVIALMNEPQFKRTTVGSVLNAACRSIKPSLNVANIPQNYEIYWKQSPSSTQPDSSIALREMEDYTKTPSFTTLLNYLAGRNSFSPREKELDENINQLVRLYIINCLYELGWHPEVHKSFDVDELAIDLKIVRPFIPAFRHLMMCLPMETNPFSPKKTKDNIKQILEKVSQYAPVGTVIQLIGSQLAAIFLGKIKSSELNRKEGSTLVDNYQKHSRFFNNKVKASSKVFVEVAKEIWTREKGQDTAKIMRILEIGEGTSFAADELAALDENAIVYEYFLSGCSFMKLEAAAAKLKNYSSSLVLKSLDIGADVLEQGFSPAYFDIVVVRNTLHRFKNLQTCLGNLRKLLKVGGTLIIEEINGPNPELNIVFGVFEELWNYEDLDIRLNHWAANVEQWASLMEGEGFHSVHKISHSENNMAILVGQLTSNYQLNRITNEAYLNTERPQKCWLLICDRRKIAFESIEKFMANLERDVIALHFQQAGRTVIEDLLKNKNESLEGILVFIEEDSGDDCRIFLEPLLHVSKCLIKTRCFPKLIIASNGCSLTAATLWGFVRTAQLEIPGLKSKLIDLDPACGIEERLHLLFHEIWMAADNNESELRYRNRVRSCRRMRKSNIGFEAKPVPIPASKSGDFCIDLPSSNLISDLKYSASTNEAPLSSNEIEIRVRSVSLNFRDVFSVLKPTPEFETWGVLGMDFAGVITAIGENMECKWKVGESVFGFTKQQTALRGLLRYSRGILAAIPNKLTFSDAATFPVAFLTAWHSIVNVARAKRDQTILIHAASGGVGLMAIQIANFLGLNIIGTAGNERKRSYLRHLGLPHVFSSRTLEFGQKILDATNGQGVDIVLNCLTGPGFKEISLKVCKDGGYFVELSRLDIWESNEVHKMRPNVFYEIVYIMEVEDSILKNMLDHLTVLVEKGSISPIPFTAFSASRVSNAMTFLQKAKQIGKVVVEMPCYDIKTGAMREYLFNSESSYLITGGKGAIGLAIVEWMVEQGAKYLVLIGRSPPTGKAQEKIQQLENQGAKLVCVEMDISDYDQSKKVLSDIESTYKLPPLRGIHHCAGLLSDKMIIHQEWEDFERVLSPKAKGALNLHELTQGKSLQFFVLHSSMSATLGNAGQSNYTAANAYLEALIKMRHGMGLNGLCISWGHWNTGLGENLELKAYQTFTVERGIQALEQLFWGNREQPCVAVGSINTEELVKLRPAFRTTLLEEIIEEVGKDVAENDQKQDVGEKKPSFLEIYGKAGGLQERELAIKNFVQEVVADTIGVGKHEIEDDTLFVDMGMDSLLSIEFHNRLQTQLGQAKSLFVDMEEYDTVTKMEKFIKKSLDSTF